MFPMIRRKAPSPPPAEIGGVRVKPSSRARRFTLRVDARSGEVVLTFPPRGSEQKALRFIEANRDWIARARAKVPAPSVLAHGSLLSILGRDYRIEHRPGRGLSRFENDAIVIHGQAEHLRRRLKDFLKKEAEKALSPAVREKTARLGLKATSFRVIDPRTRWGSCGPDGRLMFSWRLILAPPEVLDYVVAHEVAHRIHMNHSRKFWALCASLTENAAASRRWLRDHGNRLMAAV